jgi:hypothetical protein
MSERSKKLAHYIRRAKEYQSTINGDNHDELLDKGFAFLKIDLEREFHNQINDVNHEPSCTGAFCCSFADKGSRVFKTGEENRGLTIDFNPNDRTAIIKGKEPISFYYFIQVKLAKDETKCFYAGGENIGEPAPISRKLDSIVEEALFALLGIGP